MRIGLTQRVLLHRDRAYDSLEHSWYEFLQGHTLVPIPNRLPVDITDLDALIITGGDDNPIRNQVEQSFVEHMMLLGRPILGVCHGAQLLTRLLGGSIISCEDHQNCHHAVTYQNQQYLVNSYHKFSINRPPPGATVLAQDSDGCAEAWILGRTAGVMWHPERMRQPWLPAEIQNLLP